MNRVIALIKKLPVDENPPIKTVNGYAFPFSVIGGRYKNFAPWLTNHFLNISYHPLHFLKRLDRLCFKKSPYLFWSFFHFKIKFIFHKGDIVASIKRELDSDNYISLILNEYFIPGKSSYKKKNFLHDKHIYGYNDDLNAFYVLSIAENGMYKKHEISYENMQKAFCYYFYNHCFLAFRLKDYDFSKTSGKKIKKQLRRYLSKRKNHGIHCYDLIIEHFRSLASNEKVNMLILRMFKEHKNILFLLDDTFATIKQQFDALFYWCIKYNLNFDKSILERQIIKLQKMKTEEYALIQAYLEELQTQENQRFL